MKYCAQSIKNPTMLEKAEKLIKQALPDASVEFRDFKNDGMHFFLTVTSATFHDKPLVEQHRTVMGAIRELIDSGELHAVKLKTLTP